NYIVTGYTHTHYREELVKQLKEQGQCSEAIILKGMEGGTHLSMTRETVCIHYNGKEIIESVVHPANFGLEPMEEKQDKTILPEDSVKEGINALKGEKNYARENILYLPEVILSKFDLTKSFDRNSLKKNLENYTAWTF